MAAQAEDGISGLAHNARACLLKGRVEVRVAAMALTTDFGANSRGAASLQPGSDMHR